MFKTPRLYRTAAVIAKEYNEGNGSIKQLVFSERLKHSNIKALFALVSNLFRKKDVVETILKRSKILIKEPRFDPWVVKILIVELLWGKRSLSGSTKVVNTIRAYEQSFKAYCSNHNNHKDPRHTDIKVISKPRYVRINTLFLSVKEAIEAFRDEGWSLSKFSGKDYKNFLEKVASLKEKEFMVDIHVPDLLIFPPKTEFHNHPAYKQGCIVLQDKASCLAVQILAPPKGSTVLDMCAAPGIKASHLAAFINNEGIIYAVDRELKRFQILNGMVKKLGATCVKTFNQDILNCESNNFPGVEYILVDPSCSGSGLLDRLTNKETVSSERLKNLVAVQCMILRAALTNYPEVKRVVYSTCSLCPDENEDVVRQVLETNSNFKLVPASEYMGRNWFNFGSPHFGEIGSFSLYARPEDDLTTGFFIAIFERLQEGEENIFFNKEFRQYRKFVNTQHKNYKSKKIKPDNINYQPQDKKLEKNEYEMGKRNKSLGENKPNELDENKVRIKRTKQEKSTLVHKELQLAQSDDIKETNVEGAETCSVPLDTEFKPPILLNENHTKEKKQQRKTVIEDSWEQDKEKKQLVHSYKNETSNDDIKEIKDIKRKKKQRNLPFEAEALEENHTKEKKERKDSLEPQGKIKTELLQDEPMNDDTKRKKKRRNLLVEEVEACSIPPDIETKLLTALDENHTKGKKERKERRKSLMVDGVEGSLESQGKIKEQLLQDEPMNDDTNRRNLLVEKAEACFETLDTETRQRRERRKDVEDSLETQEKIKTPLAQPVNKLKKKRRNLPVEGTEINLDWQDKTESDKDFLTVIEDTNENKKHRREKLEKTIVEEMNRNKDWSDTSKKKKKHRNAINTQKSMETLLSSSKKNKHKQLLEDEIIVVDDKDVTDSTKTKKSRTLIADEVMIVDEEKPNETNIQLKRSKKKSKEVGKYHNPIGLLSPTKEKSKKDVIIIDETEENKTERHKRKYKEFEAVSMAKPIVIFDIAKSEESNTEVGKKKTGEVILVDEETIERKYEESPKKGKEHRSNQSNVIQSTELLNVESNREKENVIEDSEIRIECILQNPRKKIHVISNIRLN